MYSFCLEFSYHFRYISRKCSAVPGGVISRKRQDAHWFPQVPPFLLNLSQGFTITVRNCGHSLLRGQVKSVNCQALSQGPAGLPEFSMLLLHQSAQHQRVVLPGSISRGNEVISSFPVCLYYPLLPLPSSMFSGVREMIRFRPSRTS